jgi:hypothetical protein
MRREEILSFQQWARRNYIPHTVIKSHWHPVLRAECKRINTEASLAMQKAIRDSFEGL